MIEMDHIGSIALHKQLFTPFKRIALVVCTLYLSSFIFHHLFNTMFKLLLLYIAAAFLPTTLAVSPCLDGAILTLHKGSCICQKGTQLYEANTACTYTSSCQATCPTGSLGRRKRQQVLLRDEKGDILNCPAGTESCPINVHDNSGYECITPLHDMDNCGGCSVLGKGVVCGGKGKGIKHAACVMGKCEIYSCSNGYIYDSQNSTCVASA